MYTLELSPLNSNVKSFYNKAKVLILDNGTIQLQSYNTIVCEIDTHNKFNMLWDGKSCTTTRHINEFKKQFNDLMED
jgi:queuine/archaeosine tRNA-ribosyltransferase